MNYTFLSRTKPVKIKEKPRNPIEAAIRSCFEHLPPESLEIQPTIQTLVSRAPKRWVVYPPLVLLPSGSFGKDWWGHAGPVRPEFKAGFWRKILFEIGRREGKGVVTHLAINSGIPLNKNGSEEKQENILRSPSGLIMLYGDFGPALNPEQMPTELDLRDAFWVSTKQNGITQIWAPRYTMFSRGNVKEKSRLLDFHGPSAVLESRKRRREELGREMAVDLYAAIGYFVFSYVKMGMGRVLGWEINPWSVEGLRRGAVANGWSVKVVRAVEELMPGNEMIVIFLEDNQNSVGRLTEWFGDSPDVKHVNCGLLPSSEAVWGMALDILRPDGWLHLHENVGVNDIKQRSREIEDMMQNSVKADEADVRAEHVELVKTFAPGVWHCVFDIYISDIDH